MGTLLWEGMRFIAVASHGAYLYGFGGEAQGSGSSTYVHRFDPQTGEVVVLHGRVPWAMSGGVAVPLGEHVYLTGGSENRIWRYHPPTEAFELVPGRFNRPLSHLGAVAVGGCVYFIGGINDGNNSLDEIRRWDPQAPTDPVVVARLPTARFGLAAATDGTRVYAFSGLNGGADREILRWDPASSDPPALLMDARLPEIRHHAGIAVANGAAYLLGGGNLDGRIYRFHFATETLSLLPRGLAIRVQGGAAGAVSSRVAVFGGWIGGGYTNEIQRFDPAAPGAPASLAATAGPRAGDVTLTWAAPDPVPDATVASYRVYRGRSGRGLAALPDVVTTTSFLDAGLPDGLTHDYRVTAITETGDESAPSAIATARTFSRPSAPRSLTARGGERAGEIALAWFPPVDAAATGLDGYSLYERDAEGRETWIGSAGAATTSTVRTGVPPGAPRTFEASARNGFGEGPRSNAASAIAASAPPAAPPVLDPVALLQEIHATLGSIGDGDEKVVGAVAELAERVDARADAALAAIEANRDAIGEAQRLTGRDVREARDALQALVAGKRIDVTVAPASSSSEAARSLFVLLAVDGRPVDGAITVHVGGAPAKMGEPARLAAGVYRVTYSPPASTARVSETVAVLVRARDELGREGEALTTTTAVFAPLGA